MDHARASSPTKSALPRLSKLPTPQPSRTTINHAAAPPISAAKPVVRLTSPTKPLPSAIQSAGRRTSGIRPPIGLTPRPSSSQASRPASPIKSIKSPTKVSVPGNAPIRGVRQRPKSVQVGPSYGGVHVHEDANDRLGALTSLSSSSRHALREKSLSPSPGSSPFVVHATPQPSLSDRTIESLAKLPGTPASDRRRSGVFHNAESPMTASPMGPPARPASAMSALRRSALAPPTASKSALRPLSPVKRTIPGAVAAPRAGLNHSKSVSARRSMSATIPRPSPAPTSRTLAPPSSTKKTTTTQPGGIKQRSAAKPAAMSAATNGATGQARSAAVRVKSQVPAAVHTNDDSEPSMLDDESPQPSSNFRAAIEKAKATHLATKAHSHGNGESNFDLSADPFNQRPQDDGNAILEKRIDVARRQGKLNISALGLGEMPQLVLHMYDAQSMADSGTAWHEAVDLVTVNAADNALSCLSTAVFPDVDPEDAMQDDTLQASVFAGVERMDFRGNQLITISTGIHYLRRLTSLNLTRNQLGNTALEVLTHIPCLKELYMADNNLSGFLTQDLKLLSNLEILDVSNNRILNIPDSIHELGKLRILNVSSNQLTGVPMDALEGLPLVELDVSSNALVGALFPFSVTGLKSIQQLNVANNSLASLAFSENVSLPNIRILKVSNNRMVTLPDMSGWQDLVTLAAGGNKFTQLPQGFVSLRKIRHADFSSNELTRIDERMALMDCLESLVLSANPLAEKKFLTMSADSIKRALQLRVDTPMTASVRSSDSFMDEAIDVRSPQDIHSPFKVSRKGALDLTAQGLVDEDADGLRQLLGQNDVKTLSLTRNKLTNIPYELSLAQNMTFLDLSMCELGEGYLQERLNLPVLQELQMSGNKVSSFEPLLSYLNAPYLTSLDVSNNRLQGELPILRNTFNHLTHLYAADNKIEAISLEALIGFDTIALPRNSLRTLPAEIGLLWFEGLRQLDVGSNYFRVPNREMLDRGTEALLSWLRTRIPDYEGDDETF